MDLLLLYEAIACERELERERACLMSRARSAVALDRETQGLIPRADASRRAVGTTPPGAVRAAAPPPRTAEG